MEMSLIGNVAFQAQVMHDRFEFGIKGVTVMNEPRLESLEARVAFLEREQDGEKRVTRHILEQNRLNGDDLAALRTRMERIERKFDGFDRKFEAFAGEFPKLMADVMREVMREERKA